MTQLQLAQAERILNAVQGWLAAAPGRRLTLRHDGVHWRATLDESKAQRGDTLLDAMAQAATVCQIDNELGEEIQTE